MTNETPATGVSGTTIVGAREHASRRAPAPFAGPVSMPRPPGARRAAATPRIARFAQGCGLLLRLWLNWPRRRLARRRAARYAAQYAARAELLRPVWPRPALGPRSGRIIPFPQRNLPPRLVGGGEPPEVA